MFANKQTPLAIRESLSQSIFTFFLALIFAVFAALQWNDPDPLVWMAIYGGTSLACVASAFFRLPGILGVAAVVLALVFAAWLWPGETKNVFGEMEGNPVVEEARESMGMVIVAGAFIYLLWRSLARVRSSVVLIRKPEIS